MKEFRINYKKKISDTSNWNGLSKEAQNLSKTIEDLRLDEVKKQIKKKQAFNANLYSGDESIFLDQFSKFGKTLDFAYLYGKKNDKFFIGFQMKCYFEKSNLKEKFIYKPYIKKNCRKILVNTMKLFNCKITHWYYYIIFYYNKKNINENISESNLSRCRDNNISYFFYDPISKEFYKYEDNKYINMKDLIIDENANLENNVIDVNKFSFELMEKKKLKIGKNMKEMIDSFIDDLSKALNIENKNHDITDILSKIATQIGIKDCLLYFHAKCEFNKALICPKFDNFILLYKKKDVNNNIDFIASIKEKENLKYIDVSTGKVYKKIYEVIDEDSEYYYCLIKIQKPKKRNYMQFIEDTIKK